MHASQQALVSKEDYLRAERKADSRSEYHQGQIFAMAGASRNHNRIVTNVSTALDNQFKQRDCNNYSSNMRVSVRNGDSYVYPDAVVTCGEERFEDNKGDTLLNPIVIIEVLSSSTEAYDRGAKFLCYQAIDSLQIYVFISQQPHRVEVYEKQKDGHWAYISYHHLPESIELKAIKCRLESDDIYSKVLSE